MCLRNWCVSALLLSLCCVSAAQTSVVASTTLTAQKSNNTSAANSFPSQTNGNIGANNVSKVDIHTLLYGGATTRIYAHLLLWFGESNHMNNGYNSTDPNQIHNQISDMVSRGIDGVIIDWYGPNNNIDQATKLVMAEAENHPGFTFAIMVDQGAIKWNSCSGCDPQQALINQLQYVEQTYFPSKAYMTLQGKPVITNFNVDLGYAINWDEVTQALSTQPAYIFQNNSGFTHVLTEGSYSWVMPTTTDYGMGYLTSFYDIGIPLANQETVGATYKGFNDTLASWGSNRIMGQQCGQTWLQTFSKVNSLYNSANQLPALQLVTWNDYEEGTEIESGIDNCATVSASTSGNSLQWSITGNENTIDHYVPYISTDGQNLMALSDVEAGSHSLNLCSYSFANGNYTLYVQAVGKPTMTNRISPAVQVSLSCDAGIGSGSGSGASFTLETNPSSMTLASGHSGNLQVSVASKSGAFKNPVVLSCSGLPTSLKCLFAPGSVTPGSNGAISVLTIGSNSVTADRHSQERSFLFLANGLFGAGLFGILMIGKLDRQRLIRALGGCAAAAVVMGAISCSGYSAAPSNAASQNTYVVTIHGNAGSVQLSTSVTVTVKQ